MTGGTRVCAAVAVFGLVVLLSSGALADYDFSQDNVQMLGIKECTYGPSYWCRNITKAASCKAVKHCIQTVWETHKYPEDTDDICTICKNMVKQARDTLESNTTMDELKQVFHGSCQLLPLKVIKTECTKLTDDFINELIETLASQMDPNVVCTISGLCNNERIDKLLIEEKNKQLKKESERNLCEQCAIVMNRIERIMKVMSGDEIIQKVYMICGELSSYSDACISTVVKYNIIVSSAIQNEFTRRNLCILSGMCSEAFHSHTDNYESSRTALMGVQITNTGEHGRIHMNRLKVSDDLTCEFCETMIKHLRDILISNTTEEQFLEVLQGLCKQTSFSNECLSVVNVDYKRVYHFLLDELDGKKICEIVGVCPKSLASPVRDYKVPMYPLIPIELLSTQEPKRKENIEQNKPTQKPTLLIVEEEPPKVQNVKPIMKSPVIDVFHKEMHFVVNDVDLPTDEITCFVCQSVINYVQQVVSDPKFDEKINVALENACLVLPKLFEQQCKQIVDQYSGAFIAVIAEEVDSVNICPDLKLCPSVDLSLTTNKDNEGSNNCSMCVIFMSALESEISNKDTEEVIKKKLEKLCTKLPSKWKSNCIDIVSNQFESIIDMFVAKVKPEEICVLLDICTPKTISDSVTNNLETNMIATSGKITVVFPDYNMGQLLANNFNMLEEPKVPTPFCLICTVVMKYLNSEVKDKSNQDDIKNIINSMCRVMPNTEEQECQTFVNLYYKKILEAIQIGTDPGIACMAFLVCEKSTVNDKQSDIHLIQNNAQSTTTETIDIDKSDECVACEAFVKVFEDRLNNNTVNIDEADLSELCSELDIALKDQCLEIITSYNQTFKNLFNQIPTWMMCEKTSLCSKNKSVAVHQMINKNCLQGAKYWCASWDNARACKVKNDILNLLAHSCKLKTKNTNDWLLRSLIKIMRTNCEKNYGKTQNIKKFHPKCTICKDIIKDIKHKIENSNIEKDIMYRLESLCDALPYDNKKKCVNLVEAYTSKVLDDIIDTIQEESVCAEIGYC